MPPFLWIVRLSLTHAGAWDVMRWDGDVVDYGLMFAPNVDADAWRFTFIDTDHSGGADTLRVTHSASE